jgi:tetratricopeptide (TPR) repeat protein
MKYKVLFLFFLLLFVGYIYLSLFNSDNVKLYVGNGKYYETTIANYVAASFVLGVIISIIASFFTDMRRAVASWRREKKERRKGEIKELFEKAKLFEMKGEPEKAADCFNRVIRTSPEMEEPYLLLADMYINRKEFDRAEETLNLAEKSVGRREAILFKRIRMHRARNDLESMERDLKEILKTNESNLDALRMLRDIYIGRKKWDEALSTEDKVRKQIKTEGENMRLVGLRYERAKELFERQDERFYEQISKDLREITSEHKRFIPAYILSAEVYKKMGRLNDAGRVYGRGYSKTGHVIFLQKMEDLYVDRGEPGVILKIYRRLLELAPKNQFLIFLYAKLCLKLEMIDEAIDLFNSLLADEKEFRGLHRAMAEAYIHRGKLRDAVEEFGKAFPINNVYIPFYCEKCQSVKDDWTDFCEACYSWNTVNIRQEGLFRKEAEDLRVLYEQDWEASS